MHNTFTCSLLYNSDILICITIFKRSCINLNVLGLTHMTNKGSPTHRGGLWVMVEVRHTEEDCG